MPPSVSRHHGAKRKPTILSLLSERAVTAVTAIRRQRLRLQGSAFARRVARRHLLSLVLAAVVAFAVIHTVADAELARTAWGQTESVIIARDDLSPGAPIDRSSTRIVEVPRSLIPASALSEVPLGRFASNEIGDGEILTTHDVSGTSTNPLLAALSNESSAVTVSLGDAPPPLRVGDEVDVYTGVVNDGGASFGDTGAIVVGRGATVLDVNATQATLGVDASDVESTVSAALGSGVSLVIVG